MNISPKILQQLGTEIASWRRLLSFMRTENVHLKTRIAEIASDAISGDLLSETENFQDRFIQIDEMISLTFREITGFQSKLTLEFSRDDNLRGLFMTQQKLRSEIETLEQKFNKLKFHFNYYLGEKL